MAAPYTVTMSNQTIIADSEMISLRAATALASRASILEILRMSCAQSGTSTSQQLGIRWGQKASAFSTNTSTTPAPTIVGTVASGITGSTSVAAASAGTDSSSIGGGTLTVLGQDSFNNLNGWLWVPTPEERIIVSIDLAFVLALVGTPTTLTGWNASLTFRELT